MTRRTAEFLIATLILLSGASVAWANEYTVIWLDGIAPGSSPVGFWSNAVNWGIFEGGVLTANHIVPNSYPFGFDTFHVGIIFGGSLVIQDLPAVAIDNLEIDDGTALLNSNGSLLTLLSGDSYNNYILQNAGALQINHASRLINDQGAFLGGTGSVFNSGTITTLNNSGILNNSGFLWNHSGTLNNSGFLADSGTLENSGIVSSNGIFIVTSTGLVDNTNSGVMDLAQIDVYGTMRNDGLVQMTDSSPLTIEAGGTLCGYGTIIGNVLNSGTLCPGNSPGIFTIEGSYIQTSIGIFLLEIGGPNVGQYDQLSA